MKLNLTYKYIYFFSGVVLFVATAIGIVNVAINPAPVSLEVTPIIILAAVLSLGLFTCIDVFRSRSLFGGWLINKTGNLVLAIIYMGACIFSYFFLSHLESSTYLIFSAAGASLVASFAAQATFIFPSIAAPRGH